MASSESHRSAIAVALQFLTVLPVSSSLTTSSTEEEANAVYGLSMLWYPAVGLLVGAILIVAAALLPLPFYVEAAFLVGLWAVLTGGLHLDGVADCADAWFGGLGDKERTLELLKDPLCGSMAVVALITLLLLKAAAVAALIQAQSLGLLWLAPVLARTALLQLFLSSNYVREGGLGTVLATYFSRDWATRLVFAVSALSLVWLGFWGGLIVLISVYVVFACIKYFSNRRIGGFTGDVAGATVEIVEATVLLALVASVGAMD